MRVWLRCGIICAVVTIAMPDAHARTYFVAPEGRDANPGTRARPFCTIQRAADLMQPGDTCVVRAGVYRETVRPARSGEQGKPITFAACPGEKVIISGADPIRGWEREGGAIYQAEAPWPVEQLFADGQMLNLARWPNSGLDPMQPTWAAAGAGSGPSLIVDPTLPDCDLAGALIHILPGAQWVSWTRPVAEYDRAARALKFNSDWSQDWAYAVREGSRYYLMGVPALLDAPGEWWMDRERKVVRVWLPRGDAPARHRVEAKRREVAFDLSERSHVRVVGFRIFAAAITLQGASHCIVEKCHLRYPCHFTACEGWGVPRPITSGIIIGGRRNVVRECSVLYSAGNGVALGGERNALRNCLVRNCNYMATDCGAVWAEGQGNVIMRNTLCDSGRSVLVHRTLKGGVIAYNDMHHGGLLTNDLGITYCYNTDGAGTIIAYNLVHHNRAASCGVGIYIDNDSRNFVIHHNVCWGNPDSGIRLNTPSHNNLVYNNTVVDNGNSLGYWGPDNNRDQARCRVLNNIFTDDVATGDGVEVSHNFVGKEPGFVNPGAGDFRLREEAPCVDAGIVIPGFTPRFAGSAPDLGAYEAGRRAWRAGHDWDEPPQF